MEEHLTVGHVARLAGVTVRTLTPQEQLGMLGARLYDAIGGAYPATRGTEPRIAERIWDALEDAQTVLNVGAYWRRPEAYLQEHIRRAVSTSTRVGPHAEQRAARSLRDDLESGRWAERNRDVIDLDAAELGLRLLVA